MGVEGMREKVSLCILALQLFEYFQILHLFNPFGYYVQLHVMSHTVLFIERLAISTKKVARYILGIRIL